MSNELLEMPLAGLCDAIEFGKFKTRTTYEMTNWWTIDPLTGRAQLSQRAGLTKYTSTVLAANTRVHTLLECIYANPLSLYTNASSAGVEWAHAGKSAQDVLDGKIDADGNRWYLDGANGIVKENADGVFQLRIALPSVDAGCVVRALAVDSAGLIFAGTSGGPDVTKARLWAFEEIENNKTQLLWELSPGWFTETLKIDSAGLYAAQNDTVGWFSRVALYIGYSAPNPTLIRSWDVSYPCNDMDVSTLDGGVWTTHQPNSVRGRTPRSPDSTATTTDWTPYDLPHSGERLWAHWSADDIDGDGSMNKRYADGDIPTVLVDKTGNGRNWYPGPASDTLGSVSKRGFGGRDTLAFNGSTMSMQSARGFSMERAHRRLNKTALPQYDGAQFALTMIFRTRATDINNTATTPTDMARRWILSNVGEDSAAGSRTIWSNAGIGAAFPTDQINYGSIFLHEDTSLVANAADRANGSLNRPLNGMYNSDGIVILTWVFDGGIDDAVGTATRSSLWVNGVPVDRWHSKADYANILPTYFGVGYNVNGSTKHEINAGDCGRFIGDFLEAFVLCDWTTSDYGATASETRQPLISEPDFPDALWFVNDQSELSKCQGYIAHRWGASHKLPSGFAAVVHKVANWAAADTITIDATTYTFRAALTTPAFVANEVLLGGSTFASLVNLVRAVNDSGSEGIHYSFGTLANPTVWARGAVREGDLLQAAIVLQTREVRNGAFTVVNSTPTLSTPFTGANWTEAGSIITGSFPGYAYAAGDTVTMTAGTGVTPGNYALTAGGLTQLDSADITAGAVNITDSSLQGYVLSTTITAVSSRNSARNARGGFNTGHYPHPYYLYPRTGLSAGGPPRKLGGLGSSMPYGLTSPYGILAKWDATNGTLLKVLTSNGPGQAGIPFGGIGFGVRCLPSGNVICCGPRQPSVAAPISLAADNSDVRKMLDLPNDALFIAASVYGAGLANSWYANPGALTYQFPRMAVDTYGNVYVPVDIAGVSALMYTEAASGASPIAATLTINNLTSDPAGRAVAVDPATPAFLAAHANKRAELITLFSVKATTTNIAVHNLRLVTVTPNTGAPHSVTARAAICGADLHQIFEDGTHSLISAGVIDTNARFVDWATTFGWVFITDGVGPPKIWQPSTGSYGQMRGRAGGSIPKRPVLVEPYLNRVFWARLADEPTVVVASAAGDPFGYDYIPKGDAVIPLAAWHSQLSETTANFPDTITCLCAKENDLLVIGGERSIFVLRGDPMAGGRFDKISEGIGIAFGRARCFTPDGTFWFISDQGELRRIMPDALASRALQTPPLISSDIANRLSAAIDFSVCRPELHYDPRDERLHIRLFKYSAADTTLLRHFTYEISTGAFSDLTSTTNAVQAASMLVISGTSDQKRTILEGGHDGYVRKHDATATSDDGVLINPSLVVPFIPNDAGGMEWSVENLVIHLTHDSGQYVLVEFVESDDPDNLSAAFQTPDSMLGPGENTPSVRLSGNFLAMRIKGDGVHAQRISIIEARCEREPCSEESRLRSA